MTVDTYSICPCGSGKKIKFCKCKDSVSQLDGVLKMIEGGQVVPALDRLSSILQGNPDAAWALAIRGRLLLDLREYDSLSENAERFIRLQPSNPLALTQRAASQVFRGKTEDATESMLQALTESGRDVDTFVLDVASVLAFSLAQRGVFLTARAYATLALTASGYEGGQTAVTVLRQMNAAPTISQLMKAVPDPIERPADADWGERYDEAAGLLQGNKIDLAESKFASLRRTAPDEPAVISGLLTCAIWRGDTDAQVELLRKLSTCESLSFDQRARFRAMSALVKPGSDEISIPTYKLTETLENLEEVEMALTADARFVALPPDMLGNMRESEDDVPPRAGFQVLDRDKPASIESLPPVDEVPEAVAMVLLFGKQTDRDAQLVAMEVRQDDLSDVRERLTSALGAVSLEQETGEPLPLLVACQPAVAMIRFQASPLEAEKLQSELTARRMPETIASLKLPLLGGASLRETADDESKLLERTAAMKIFTHYDAIASRGDAVLEPIYQLAKLDPPAPIHPTDDDVERIENEDLNRVDPSGLDSESLVYLLQRAQQIRATPALKKIAAQLIQADLTEERRPAKLLAYMTLINAADGNEEALQLLDKAKAYAESNDLPVAELLLSEVGLRLNAGDGVGFQKAIETISSRYGQEPEVMARLQQMLMAYGLIRPDGSPRTSGGRPEPAAAPGAAGGSGLWTPDGGTAATPGPAKEGGGKLWVPGMD